MGLGTILSMSLVIGFQLLILLVIYQRDIIIASFEKYVILIPNSDQKNKSNTKLS